jgi:hypothetical protein
LTLSAELAFDQHEIAELVRAIMVLLECCRDLLQNRIIDEGAQKLEVAFTRFVHPGQDRIDDLKARFTG